MGEDEKKDEEIYDEAGREELVEDDEISAEEEGFMEGADEDGQNAKCRSCGKNIEIENTVEEEINGELCRFCSEQCLKAYISRKKQ